MATHRRKAGSEQLKSGPVSVPQVTVSWPHGRGDLILDIELHSGPSPEALPHARLQASEHDSGVTPLPLEGSQDSVANRRHASK